MTTDAQKAQEQYELYQYCRVEGGHEHFLREMELAKRYYASKHWSRDDERRRTSEGRLTFTVNETFRTINALLGEMGQLVSDVRFDPTHGDEETARVLNRLSEYVDHENKLFMEDERVLLDGMLGGRGYYKFRIRFDENMMGHIGLTRQRPENTVLDYNIHSPDPETWDRVFTTEVVSHDDVANMYGEAAAKHLGETTFADWLDLEDRTLAQSLGMNSAYFGDIEGNQFRRHRLISQQYREYKYKDHFVDKRTGDTSEIPENWPREKVQHALDTLDLSVVRRKLKTVRWRVTCNNIVLHDEDSPYRYFDVVPYFPWFIDGTPLSLFSVLKGPQDLLNYTVSEETHILGNTAHTGWKIKTGSLRNMTMRQLETRGSKNGLILELDDIADAERITPGQPATGFQNFGDRARSWINDLANVSPSMLGTQSEYAPGRGVSAQLSRGPVNLHGPLTMFQYSKQLLAERKLDLFQNFYTETRVMKVASGPAGKPEELAINQPDGQGNFLYDLTVGKYTVRMLPVGSRLRAQELGFDQLKYMKEVGMEVPASLFVSVSALNAKTDVIEQLIAANGGDVSPEEQRAKQLQLEQMELDSEDKRASIEGKRAAAELARGRAKRAEMDASFDPRTHRASLDEMRLQSENARNMRQLEYQERQGARDTAVKLTKIAADAAKPTSAPAGKPAAKKAVTKKVAKKTPAKTP